ncbi:MAG: DUF1559 domain-containing protein, partial [Planctomycetota bacterium]
TSPRLRGPSGGSDSAATGGPDTANTDGAFAEAEVTLTPAGLLPPSLTNSRIDEVRLRLGLADITDGLSNTFQFGEKYLPDVGGDNSVANGRQANAFVRYTGPGLPPASDRETVAFETRRFGGPHPGGVQFALCDGSVRLVTFTVDAEVYRRLGDRRDGEVVGEF